MSVMRNKWFINQNAQLLRRLFSRLTIIENNLDTKESNYLNGKTCSENINNYYEQLLTKIKDGGGVKAINRHTKINKKILVRERLKRLFDEDSPTLEIAPFAGTEMDYGNLPAAGVVTMIGKIHGLYCIIGGNDATVKAGAAFPISVVKNLRAQALAFINYLPSIHLVDSAGAFLPLQSEIFPDRNHGGRTFRNEAVLSSRGIPQISIVAGSCTAGGAYAPTMTEEAIIIKDIGLIYLGGPPLVKAATGEIVTDQELGGAEMHSKMSGCTDHYATTEEEAYDMCRDTILTLNIENCQNAAKPFSEPLYKQSEINAIAGKIIISKNDMYQILARLLDGSSFKEFKTLFGKNLITGFGFLKGNLVGVLANCGRLNSPDGQKGAHFVELCEKRAIPMIFLQNSSGWFEKESSEQESIAYKDKSKLIYAHSNAKVSKITVNIGGCIHDDNYTMCGASFKPNFIFSWPLAQISLHENQEREKLVSSVSSPNDYTELLFEDPTSAFYLASCVHLDNIILPEDTRATLGLCLEVIQSGNHNKVLAEQRMTRMPVFRM